MKNFRVLASKITRDQISLGELLEKVSKLSRSDLINAAAKGAIWVQQGKGKVLRQRSLKTIIKPQDTVSLFYDPKVLSLPQVESAECFYENEHYGVWLKGPGVLAQGTQYGDHSSLMRFIEIKKSRPVYLVHRLDRETGGLMVFAYSSNAAGKISELFQKSMITKLYEVIVLGEMKLGTKGTIDTVLDNKSALTHYEVLEVKDGKSRLVVKIDTGRLHQIRRHLESIGHPVMGDPKYGKGNKNRDGLELLAKSISFTDPWDKKIKIWAISEDLEF